AFGAPDPHAERGLQPHLGPRRRRHPPLAEAGASASSETLGLAGERGYIPMSINFVPAGVLRTHWEGMETGARRTGRRPDRATWRIARDVFVGETTAEARRQALEGPLARDWRGASPPPPPHHPPPPPPPP